MIYLIIMITIYAFAFVIVMVRNNESMSEQQNIPSGEIMEGWALQEWTWGRGEGFGCRGTIPVFRGRYGVSHSELGFHFIPPNHWESKKAFKTQVQAMLHVQRLATV